MEKKTTDKNTVKTAKHSTLGSCIISQIESPSKQLIAELRARKKKLAQREEEQQAEEDIQSEQSEKALHIEQTQNSEQPQHTENTPILRRISAKMRKETLEAYKQAYLSPTKLSNRKAVYLRKETQERADLVVRRLGDRGSNLSSFIENLVRSHLEEYHEDIEKWRKL